MTQRNSHNTCQLRVSGSILISGIDYVLLVVRAQYYLSHLSVPSSRHVLIPLIHHANTINESHAKQQINPWFSMESSSPTSHNTDNLNQHRWLPYAASYTQKSITQKVK